MVKRVLLSIAFGVVYYASLLIGGTYSYHSYGTTWDAAFGQTLFFGTFFFVVSYPAILAAQVGLVYLIRRVRKIQEKRASVWEFIPCVLISALFLLPVTDAPRSPEAQFRQCVADKMPPSVSNFQCRQTLSFSGRGWVVSFNVAPEDLDAVLTRFPYKKEELSPEYSLYILGSVMEPPKEPMAYCYSYSSPLSEERPRSNSIYVNKERTRVYVIGGND